MATNSASKPSSNARPDNLFETVDPQVFSLREQMRLLETERLLAQARTNQLQIQMENLRKELADYKRPPYVMGSVREIMENNRMAVVRSWNGNEFLVHIPARIRGNVAMGSRVAMTQRNMSMVRVLDEGKDYRVRVMEVLERPNLTYSDVGGLSGVITELDEVVALPLTHPEKFKEMGIEIPKGILLHGAPGTGKTLLAKAVANKAHATFINVTGSELVRKYIGEGAQLVRDVFKLASEKKPAIIFIDELDSIASLRSEIENGGDREVQRTLMQLLAEMDGFSGRTGVIVMGATNRVDILDPAILRPGRFDRIVEVPLPDAAGRKSILSIHTQKMRLDSTVDLSALSEKTNGFSGAELRAICIEAGLLSLRADKKAVGETEFATAIKKLRPEDRDQAPVRMLV